MDRSTVRTLVLVGFVLGSAGIVAASFANPAPISGGVPLAAPNGLVVTVDGSTSANLGTFTDGSDTLVIETTDGNVTVSSGGAADATIHKDDITGTWTRATAINTGFTTITINPEDKQPAVVGGDIENVSFRAASEVGADDGTADFIYGGPSGTSRVSIYGAPPDTQLGAVDADTAALLDVATSNGSGYITFDDLDNSDHTVELQTSDGAPTVSDPSPTGDLDSPPSDLAATVDDPDFPSDNVEVTLTLDGSEIHSEEISAEQEVSAAIPSSGKTAGEHTWRVNATDAYGQSEIKSYSYRVPDTLYIRNESNHSQLVAGPNVSVEVQFFGDQQVYSRTTSDGTVNLTGLPVDQEMVVTVQPGNGSDYTARTAYITTIYEQQSVYLLNSTAYPTVESRFILEDPTGQFGSETVLYIEKPINISGTVTYQTIHADQFGAEGVTATLEESQRYRLRVRSPDGTTQVIGPYRAELSETVTVQPGTPTIDVGDLTDGWAATADLTNQTLEWRYTDPDNETDQLTVVIHEKGDPDNLLVSNETYFDLGNASRQIILNESESQRTWVVRFEVERDGESFVTEEPVSNRPDVLPDLAPEWRWITGILLMILSAGAFSLLNASVGTVVVSAEGALLWWIGWLDGATTGVLVVLALFIAVMVNIYNSGRP